MMDAPEHSVLLTVTQPRFWQVARQAAAAGSLSVTSPSSLLMLKDAGPAAVVFMVLTTVVVVSCGFLLWYTVKCRRRADMWRQQVEEACGLALYKAIVTDRDRHSVRQMLQQHGVVVTQILLPRHPDADERLPALHLAALVGTSTVAKELLRVDPDNLCVADPRLESPSGRTPLYYALQGDDVRCVQLLLRVCPTQDSSGRTAQDYCAALTSAQAGACEKSGTEVATMLNTAQQQPAFRRQWQEQQAAAAAAADASTGSMMQHWSTPWVYVLLHAAVLALLFVYAVESQM